MQKLRRANGILRKTGGEGLFFGIGIIIITRWCPGLVAKVRTGAKYEQWPVINCAGNWRECGTNLLAELHKMVVSFCLQGAFSFLTVLSVMEQDVWTFLEIFTEGI